MKTSFYSVKHILVTKSTCSFIVTFLLSLTSVIHAQTYYSDFTDASGKYSSVSPSGFACVSPGFVGTGNIADQGLQNYASVSGLINAAILCTQNEYSIRTKLNFPTGVTVAPAGYYAGFVVEFNTTLSVALLQSNLSIRTYLEGALRETISGANLAGVSLLSNADPTELSFVSDLSFDEVELVFNAAILPVDVAFDYHFYHAFARQSGILPVKLISFAAAVKEKNTQLDWVTASEVNMAKYELERSKDGGRTFTAIGSVAARGNSTSETKYSFIDGTVPAGENLYRLKVIDKDGAVENSKTVSVKGGSIASWQVYPNMLSRGTNINISIAAGSPGKWEVLLSNLQGQTIRVFTVNDGKLSLPTSNLPAGMYVLKLYQNGQQKASEKLVIQ